MDDRHARPRAPAWAIIGFPRPERPPTSCIALPAPSSSDWMPNEPTDLA
ncbi:hypothetical protein [Lysobacter gummosus]